jgi:hypothetical protein
LTATPEQIRDALPPLDTETGNTCPPLWKPEPCICPIVARMVESFLIWEASRSRAQRSLEVIASELVDLNELRVCLPSEMIGIVGVRYPRVRERCERLRTSLGAIFERENGLELCALSETSKRDSRAYFDSLPGMVPYVSARVVLLEFGGHAFPVDSRVQSHLRSIGCDSTNEQALAGKIERIFRAGELNPLHHTLEQALDNPAPRSTDKAQAKSGSRLK